MHPSIRLFSLTGTDRQTSSWTLYCRHRVEALLLGHLVGVTEMACLGPPLWKEQKQVVKGPAGLYWHLMLLAAETCLVGWVRQVLRRPLMSGTVTGTDTSGWIVPEVGSAWTHWWLGGYMLRDGWTNKCLTSFGVFLQQIVSLSSQSFSASTSN